MTKILIIGSHAEQMFNFRGDLIRHLQSRGHEVVTATPPPDAPDIDQRLLAWGVRRHDLAMARTGVSVREDLRLLAEIRRLMLAERPDVVLAYTIKPVVYGALASRLAHRPGMVAMITGLGLAFSPARSAAQGLVRKVARTLYRLAMTCTDTVLFQNPDDEADFRRHGLLGARQQVELTNGSGVSLTRFARALMPDGPVRFLMIARLLADKGVREYIQAAALVRARRPDVECHLVGPFDPNPSALTPDEIAQATASGAIVHHGFVRDVRGHIAAAHVYVLPSYREGTPRSVLEAMAMGRPVIVTDAPGCRETIQPGVNGLMVPVGAAQPLADAMLDLASRAPASLQAMADASYAMARDRFDVNAVNAQVAQVLEHCAALRHASLA